MNNSIRKHISTLLCIVATAGIAATAILTAKATPKAMDILKEAEKEKGEALTFTEKVKNTAPAYIPAVISGVMTSACIFGANVLSKKAQASIMSAYGIINSNYGKYVGKVKEMFGEKTHKDILKSIAVEKADLNTCCHAPGLIGFSTLGVNDIEEEKRLFYEPFTERYFESTIGRVLTAEYMLNRDYALGADVTLNDFYLSLGLEKVEGGDDVAWSASSDELDGIGWIDFDNVVSKLDDGREYIMICSVYSPAPIYE